MAVRAQKELELKVHNEFNNNVHLLTLIYPPSTEFQQVFKRDMFHKNNKAGFQQVVYYLLHILDPDWLKQKVTLWPPFDIRRETQFRNEVMKYINELNSIYEYVDMPLLATSHLISPGGFKFIKFMFKLSELVLFEHVRCNPNIPLNLLPIKPSKDDISETKANLQKIQNVTNKIHKKTESIVRTFESQFLMSAQESENIIKERKAIERRLKEQRGKLEVMRQQFAGSEEFFKDQTGTKNELEDKLSTVKKLKEDLRECNSFLDNSKNKLEHDTEINLPVPIGGNGMLNLIGLLEGCHTLTNRKRLEVKPVNDQEVLRQIERFQQLNFQLVAVNEDLDQAHAELLKLSEEYRNEAMENSHVKSRNGFHVADDDSDSGVLAVPLSLSPSPKTDFHF